MVPGIILYAGIQNLEEVVLMFDWNISEVWIKTREFESGLESFAITAITTAWGLARKFVLYMKLPDTFCGLASLQAFLEIRNSIYREGDVTKGYERGLEPSR